MVEYKNGEKNIWTQGRKSTLRYNWKKLSTHKKHSADYMSGT